MKPPDYHNHYMFLECQTNSVKTTTSMIKTKGRKKNSIKTKNNPQGQYRSTYTDSDHLLKSDKYIFLYSRACLHSLLNLELTDLKQIQKNVFFY